ncbi:MAG TPA: succinate dehydrogenase [Candidatus Caldiarchaeum subterraneum]|uniref:Succinate dehydrogenase n=1 Tax=Caldiarchaeum subterraneum TaxID=311458 RepID=A0A833EAA4_CALS0|nr:succinate dehydrogenase [Aigarchaeota archaeon]HIQ30317.1 succinate dehydrogenase [Candidatus Caldarchaeum subterraneum]
MVSERTIMLLHYITGIGILVAGAVHIATVFLTAPVEANLTFDEAPFAVINVYRNLLLAVSLEALLVMVAFHGFNGLRIILLELYQGRTWEKAVTWILTVIALVLVVYGSRTIILAYQIANLG